MLAKTFLQIGKEHWGVFSSNGADQPRIDHSEYRFQENITPRFEFRIVARQPWNGDRFRSGILIGIRQES